MNTTAEAAEASAGMFQVELLPAGHGDSVLIRYGRPDSPRHVLIDGGPARSYRAIGARLARIPSDRRRLDLLVVTHVDADHIEGIVRLLNDADLAVGVTDVWFNGYRHLPPDDYLGPPQGEMVSALLEQRGIAWNTAFDGGPVRRERQGALPRVELPDGLVLTVLGPGPDDLRALRRVWERECRRAGIVAGSTREALELLTESRRLRPLDAYLGGLDVEALAAGAENEPDRSAPNASSIVLLAEYRGRSVLLAGDATPATLAAGLERLLAERGGRVLDVDAFKLPHHGSRYNVTRDVLDLVRARTSLVSTDGKYFGHPDPAAIARLVVRGPAGGRIVFNYRTSAALTWSDRSLTDRYGFRADCPPEGAEGALVTLPTEASTEEAP